MTSALPSPRVILGISFERWLKILVGTFLAVMFLGPQFEQIADSRRREIRRHSEHIVQTYLIGQIAGVPWPEGGVEAKVDAVVTGRLPPSGEFINRLFRVVVPEEKIEDTYAYIGLNPNGQLFFDPQGCQNPGAM